MWALAGVYLLNGFWPLINKNGISACPDGSIARRKMFLVVF
jgi:hypothetical protein